MTIFERFWSTIATLFGYILGKESPVVVVWAKQFASDEGKIVLADAAQYGPPILKGDLKITDAFTKLGADLAAKGLTDLEQLGELMYNALRTQTNAAAASVDSTVAQ